MANYSRQDVLQVSLEQQRSLFRWRLVIALATEYPKKFADLATILPAYEQAMVEDKSLLPRGVVSLDGWAGAYEDTDYSPAMQTLLHQLDCWASNLSKSLIKSNGRMLFWLQQIILEILRDLGSNASISDNVIKFSRKIIKYKAVDGSPFTKVTDRPRPVMADPFKQTENEFIEECRVYYYAVKEFLQKEGTIGELIIDEVYKSEDKHFQWLAWRLVENMSFRKMALKNAESNEAVVGHTAIQKAVRQLTEYVF